MIILPPETKPPREPVNVRHTPTLAKGPEGYRSYRSCLRWEFGFTCPFCLAHETDFVWHGAEGLGVFWIEHYYTVSLYPERINEYENCLYSCRLCNRARSDAPVRDADGRQLLNPRRDAWGHHFARVGDRLEPGSGDVDAAYTCDAYDINDERKVALRAARRGFLEECLFLLEEGDQLILKLVQEGDPRKLAVAEKLRKHVRLAELVVERYAAVPFDADTECACGQKKHCVLPAGLAEQCLQV